MTSNEASQQGSDRQLTRDGQEPRSPGQEESGIASNSQEGRRAVADGQPEVAAPDQGSRDVQSEAEDQSEADERTDRRTNDERGQELAGENSLQDRVGN
jgi:hypothetical protein